MQVINVNKPKSTRNLLAVFKAGDSTANLHTALDQYEEQLTEIEGMKWRFVTLTYNIKQNDNQFYTSRDWNIQLLFTGDYEFLCTMYGLSGASGMMDSYI